MGYGQIFDYMISKKRVELGSSAEELDFKKKFEGFIVEKTFENDEEAMKYMLAGLAEGSLLKNTINKIGDDYSSMLDQSVADGSDLKTIKIIVSLWVGGILIEERQRKFILSSFNEDGSWNEYLSDDWEEEYDSKHKKSKVVSVTTQLKKKSVSKQKKDYQILKQFIENYEIEVKDDEDYYEHDISFDQEENQFHCKIDVVLESEQDKSYPFIEFEVDFSNKEVTFDPKSTNSNTYRYQDIDDLKEIIEEEIDKQ